MDELDEMVERLMDEAVERAVERVLARGGDPDDYSDEEWTALVAAEYEGNEAEAAALALRH